MVILWEVYQWYIYRLTKNISLPEQFGQSMISPSEPWFPVISISILTMVYQPTIFDYQRVFLIRCGTQLFMDFYGRCLGEGRLSLGLPSKLPPVDFQITMFATSYSYATTFAALNQHFWILNDSQITMYTSWKWKTPWRNIFPPMIHESHEHFGKIHPQSWELAGFTGKLLHNYG